MPVLPLRGIAQLRPTPGPHDAVGLEGGNHVAFPLPLRIAGDFNAVVAAAHIALVRQWPPFSIHTVARWLCRLCNADEIGDLTPCAAIGLAALLDAAVFADAVRGFLHHRALKAMVGFMAHPDVTHGALHVVAVGVPRQGHALHQAGQATFAGLGVGLGKAL